MEVGMGRMVSALQTLQIHLEGEYDQYYRGALSDGSPDVKDQGIRGRMGQHLKRVSRIHQQPEDNEQSMARWEW